MWRVVYVEANQPQPKYCYDSRTTGKGGKETAEKYLAGLLEAGKTLGDVMCRRQDTYDFPTWSVVWVEGNPEFGEYGP